MFHIMCRLRFGNAPADWAWTTDRGEWFKPSQMETRHLYNTVRMVWNNLIAPSLPVDPGPRRQLNPRRRAYWLEAMRYCAAELADRDDLEPRWEAGLNLMGHHVRHGRLKLTE